jgi:uncharacterized hydrophobic protein (TIGR00271 family)
MSVAVYIQQDSDAASLLGWAVQFARADHEDLVVVLPRKSSKQKVAWEEIKGNDSDANTLVQSVFDTLALHSEDDIVLKSAVATGEESTDHDRTIVSIGELSAADPEAALVQKLAADDVKLLVLPAFVPARGNKKSELTGAEKLFESVSCDVICVAGQLENEKRKPTQLLLVCEKDQDADDDFALAKTAQLATSVSAEVTLLYVRPSDDQVARQVADRHLQDLLKRLAKKDVSASQRVALADSLVDGINQLELSEFDLILTGTRSSKLIRRLLDGVKPVADDQRVPLAILRTGTPLADQLWDKLKQSVRSVVPQIGREHRVNLVDRLTSSSLFDFDFIALISLSTLIAALGLARDSGAVVIGAMLVAPLMTPLVAIGLALVQGNERLLRRAVKSVVLGFSVALLIGVVAGLCIKLLAPDFPITAEMYARNSPNLLDLVVAMASGVAAAYAMGRPHLISALPGVAIAAALVPPIATSGLSLAMGDFLLAGGSSLLFFTNVIAIVLGTAVTFWAVGISTFLSNQPEQQTVRQWPRYWFFGFVLVSCLLAAQMSIYNGIAPASNIEKAPAEKTPEQGPVESAAGNTNAILETLSK